MQNEIIGYKVDGKILDTQSANETDVASGEPIKFDNSKEALHIIRHSTAHLLAHACKELYGDENVQLFVGPPIEDGFYQDFRFNKKIGEEDLKTIEKKMAELAKAKMPITKKIITKDEVKKIFANDDLKQEIIDQIDGEEVGLYTQNNYDDMCGGMHVPNTRFLRFFKLTRVAGAYLGGDEEKEMLVRIYGTAFADKQSLSDYAKMIEEAKKRDHRKLGRELKLFTTDEEIGGGLHLWLPAGGRLRAKLEKHLFKIHRLRGYEPVRGPELLKSDAWRTSGHYDNYGENMYFTTIDDHEYGMKPMNCVGHVKIYQNEVRSYRDLPLKFFEYGVVHRHEQSGELHGLFRVREFTQDDAHIYCTPDQIKENVLEVVDFVDELMKTFGFEYEMMVSTKPKKAIGDDEFWQSATQGLKDALSESGLKYEIDEGGGAFYGPKIDIKITDALKRKWQCGTIQVDYNLPQRFGMEYIDKDNNPKQPVMIHRAILGSFERFIGILTEHVGGEFPFFIAPTQVAIIPISEAHQPFAKELAQKLLHVDIDADILDKNESLNKRIRNAEKMRVPMIVVIGDDEVSTQRVALRDRRTRTQKDHSVDEFIEICKGKLEEVTF